MANFKSLQYFNAGADSILDSASMASLIGAVAQPTSGTVAVAAKYHGSFFRLDFTFTGARISTTDAGASGSYGSTKIFDFIEGAISFLGCRYNQVSCVTSAALDASAGNVAYVVGLGTGTIVAAADGVLTASATYTNIGAALSLTNSSGTVAGEKITGSKSTDGADGTATAADIYLNWSGTAATSAANGTIDITGNATVVGVFLSDD